MKQIIVAATDPTISKTKALYFEYLWCPFAVFIASVVETIKATAAIIIEKIVDSVVNVIIDAIVKRIKLRTMGVFPYIIFD